MIDSHNSCSRRQMLAGSLAVTLGWPYQSKLLADEALEGGAPKGDAPRSAADHKGKALIAITLDLEMSRNFPTWETTHWDYEKGNLNDETKNYTVEACRRVKASGGVLHSFVVGQVLEHASVDWIKGIAAAGHPLGNHTYDHVDLFTDDIDKVQWRFKRAPWLIEGKSVAQVVRDNIRLCDVALRQRVGVKSNGFRMPGGSGAGLKSRPELQELLLGLGFKWVSTQNASHTLGQRNGADLTPDEYADVVRANASCQPYIYPSGLIEVPNSPVMDIAAFRYGQWKLDTFLKATRLGVEWAIENRAMYDFIGHPSCMYVVDPEFKTIDLICELVEAAGDKAAIVGLDAFAARAKANAT